MYIVHTSILYICKDILVLLKVIQVEYTPYYLPIYICI